MALGALGLSSVGLAWALVIWGCWGSLGPREVEVGTRASLQFRGSHLRSWTNSGDDSRVNQNIEALCFGDVCDVRAIILTPWVGSCSFCVCPLKGVLTCIYLPGTHL